MADDTNEINLMKHLNMGIAVLREYSWFLDSYILDFFVEQHYQKLPKCWRNHFKEISMAELGKFLDFENYECNGVWPLSLLCLRSAVKTISLSRNPNPKTSMLLQGTIHEKSSSSCSEEKIDDEIKNFYKAILKNPKLEKLFVKHVKPKKRYEILEMAKITAETANVLNVNYLVDVGSGLGHLSRMSAYGFGLNVLSVESQGSLSEEAEKLDRELEITASKYLTKKDMEIIAEKRPIHIQKTITNDITPTEFLQLIQNCFKKGKENVKFGIVGLHPCGDLALKLLNLFIQCEEIKFINIVGCCYHKVTVLRENEVKNGFPLSSVHQKNLSVLSYEARALACHALETYSKRLISNNFDHLKIHCYRATLEYIIFKNWRELRRRPLNNVKHGPELTFKSYCEKALRKMKISVPEEDLESKQTLQYLSEWKNVVIYYSLRLMLAPLVESVILMDRMLYLVENGNKCSIRALFQPEISPRNFVLTAIKN